MPPSLGILTKHSLRDRLWRMLFCQPLLCFPFNNSHSVYVHYSYREGKPKEYMFISWFLDLNLMVYVYFMVLRSKNHVLIRPRFCSYHQTSRIKIIYSLLWDIWPAVHVSLKKKCNGILKWICLIKDTTYTTAFLCLLEVCLYLNWIKFKLQRGGGVTSVYTVVTF